MCIMPRQKRKLSETLESTGNRKRKSIIDFFAKNETVSSSSKYSSTSGLDQENAIELLSSDEENTSDKNIEIDINKDATESEIINSEIRYSPVDPSKLDDSSANRSRDKESPIKKSPSASEFKAQNKSPNISSKIKRPGSSQESPTPFKTPTKSPQTVRHKSPGSSPGQRYPLRNKFGVKMGRLKLRNKSQTMQSELSSPNKTSNSPLKSQNTSPRTSPQKSPSKFSKPYYQQNFLFVIETVLASNDRRLFNDSDLLAVSSFHSLTDESQQLYIRLFQRKHKWHQKTKIVYPNIAEDLDGAFNELFQHKFCIDEKSVSNLQETLELLPAPDVKDIGKSMKIQNLNKKEDIIKSVLKLCHQKNVSTMFGMKNCVEVNVRKLVSEKLGTYYKLTSEVRDVFIRLMVLFSLSTSAYDDDSSMGGQGQLLQLLLVNMGQLKYASYNIKRDTEVFRTREDLILFQEALVLDFEIFDALEKNDFETGEAVYRKSKSVLEGILKDKEIELFASNLPEYLRAFTPGSVHVRVLNHAVDIFQKLKNYEEAVSILELLLSQPLYCQRYRGHWWERVALNYHSHLKRFSEAVSSIENGVLDPLTKAVYKYKLFNRAERMIKSQRTKKVASALSEIQLEPLIEAPTVEISGCLLPKGGWAGSSNSSSFVTQDADQSGSKTLCGVEQLALKHYQANGYPEGVHGEGSTFGTIFALLFWNIIFMDGVRDVFYCHFQSCPLDMYTAGDFYRNRKEIIDTRLQTIKNASLEDLHTMMEDTWNNHNGEICARLNWELFKDVGEVKRLVSSFGGAFLVDIFKRLLQDFSHFSSGLPDLVVWNTAMKTFKLVEVKGPGDRLSMKQILWMDYFMKIDAPAEICYVKATNSKKLYSASRTQKKMINLDT